MSKYELDLDYQIPMVDISKEELEEIIEEADAIIAENNGDSKKLAIAYLKKAQAMQKKQEIMSADEIDAGMIEYNNADIQYKIKAFLDKVLELHPDMPEAIMQIGKVYACLEWSPVHPTDEVKSFLDEAIKYYTKAIELKPDYAPAFNNRGNVYSSGRHRTPKRENVFHTVKDNHDVYLKKAIADYTEALRILPSNATYYSNRGQEYSILGEHEKAIADYTDVITYGSDEFKKFIRICHLRGMEYMALNENNKAYLDFSRNCYNLEDLAKEHPVGVTPGVLYEHKGVSCFLCNNRGIYSIGSNGLKICTSCLEKIDVQIASIFSITKEDIKNCKQTVKNEEKEREERKKERIRRIPKIYTRTIRKNKEIKCYKPEEKPKLASDVKKTVIIDDSNIDELVAEMTKNMFPEPETTKFECNNPATEIPKDGIADRQMPEDEKCCVCKRNCYVTEALFMMRNNLWICPDCLKYIDINDKGVSAFSITNEEIAECRSYLDTNTPEGKEAHSILEGGRTAMGRKIISWNCHYGFDAKKAEAIKSYNADILVIPECREMDMETSGYDAQHRYWYGDHKEATDEHGNINKEKDLGIGVFWKNGITVTPLTQWENTLCNNSDFRYLVPFKVQLDYYARPFTLIAVWTKGKNAGINDALEYVEKTHAAIDHYARMGLLEKRVVIIGDFNSNAIWDDKYSKEKNHTALVEKLKQKGVVDCSTIKGESSHSTYCYYTETGEKQVIDDYCFASKDMTKNIYFSVPDDGDWKLENGVKRWHGSDHFPICVEMDIKV